MKIGITQIVLGDMSLTDTLDLCRQARYDAVELVFSETKDLHVRLGDRDLARVRAQCAAAGVEISSLMTTAADRGNLLSRDPAERDTLRRGLVRALEIAGALGVGAVLLNPGGLTGEGTYEEAWADLRQVLRELAPVAAGRRAVIGLENVWNRFLLSPAEARAFVDEVGSPWVKLYLDTANMMAYGYPQHWIRSLGPRITRVHLKDFRRREHRFVSLGEGDTDWPLVLGELRRVGYDAPLIHEVDGDRQACVDLADRLRQLLTD
jgi:hexulose-6-phosphate isomerase